jgi:hypothetical protein
MRYFGLNHAFNCCTRWPLFGHRVGGMRMIKRLIPVALSVATGLAVAACQMDGGAKTAAPVKRPAAPDYQQAAAPSPPVTNLKSVCYNDADLAVIRGRMLQQEMAVATLQCQTAGGSRALESGYASFLSKFRSDLASNAASLQQLAGRKRFNVDVVVTEFANRMAQRAPVDKEFCGRSQRALDWAIDPRATSLSQVPPPYDLGPEMKFYPCTAQ